MSIGFTIGPITGCSRLKNTSEIDLPEVFFIWGARFWARFFDQVFGQVFGIRSDRGEGEIQFYSSTGTEKYSFTVVF